MTQTAEPPTNPARFSGLVLMGSSKASTEELEVSLRKTEGERSAAIDALDLVQFGD